jgi:hypothetical protein
MGDQASEVECHRRDSQVRTIDRFHLLSNLTRLTVLHMSPAIGSCVAPSSPAHEQTPPTARRRTRRPCRSLWVRATKQEMETARPIYRCSAEIWSQDSRYASGDCDMLKLIRRCHAGCVHVGVLGLLCVRCGRGQAPDFVSFQVHPLGSEHSMIRAAYPSRGISILWIRWEG